MAARPVIEPNKGVSVAPGGNAVIISIGADRLREGTAFLNALTTIIDPSTNGPFATMRLRVNGNPFFPLNNLTSQQSNGSDPKIYNPPLLLGPDVSVDVIGEMGIGAVGNTLMIAGLDLLLVPKGESL